MFRVEEKSPGCFVLHDESVASWAEVLAGDGFNCNAFVVQCGGKAYDLLYCEPDFPRTGKASHNGTPILAPFPNRIAAGKFTFAGATYQLDCNEHGRNAIHGFVIDKPWRVTQAGADPQRGAFITGEFQLHRDLPQAVGLWPADFLINWTYRLRGNVLASEIRVANPDDRILPFGLGTHPYFRFPLRGGGNLDQSFLQVPAQRYVPLNDYLPTGTLQPVDGENDLRTAIPLSRRTFDDVYTGLSPAPDGAIAHELRDTQVGAVLRLRHDPAFGYVVIYTPGHRKAVCIEPYTCVTNAINLVPGGDLDSGLWRLNPGEERSLWIEYQFEAM